MSTPDITDLELEAYLDEGLSPAEMARVEAALRERPDLRKQLSGIHGRRDAGMHSLGEIWRRHRLSCPTREQLGSYLLDVLDDQWTSYVRFHTERIGCRYCAANLEDLRRHQAENSESVRDRRQRYMQSSAGYLSDSDSERPR